jgi:hypothetical protein
MDSYNPGSYSAAKASASRLMRHLHVRAAVQWHYALKSREVSFGNPMPTTVFGIAVGLRDLGCLARLFIENQSISLTLSPIDARPADQKTASAPLAGLNSS